MGPIGLYIHIPFCAAHCSYCHFVIDLARGEVQGRYVEAVEMEIEHWGSRLSHPDRRRVDTLYIGGGTPSWIPGSAIEKIIQTVRNCFAVDEGAEITVEVNPDSLDAVKIRHYQEAGINRVSLGVQSFHDEELKRLGRTHHAAEAESAIQQVRQGGFDNISVDLLAGLPGQTVSHWERNFERLAALQPEHVSLYLFDEDEESVLGRKILRQASGPVEKMKPRPGGNLPDEEELRRIYDFALCELDRLGYEQYEISNFARRTNPTNTPRSSLRSRHNLKYWNMEPYLGLGCAAHSFLLPRRWHNENSTEGYIQALFSENDPRREIEEITPARLAEDAFIFGLRQIDGIQYRSLSDLLGREAGTLFRPIINPLLAEGWLIEQGDTLRLAPKTLLVSNEIFGRFLDAVPLET
ncbi:MAG: radical SAM family heme chaperone HemW [Acidobacteriia bacterium]|nr:radical SAM family heme chaperone HemW [Terriglobia bacterium]